MIPEAITLRRHLDILYPSLQEGALRGLHAGLRHLRRADVQALLDTAAPRFTDEERSATFQAAGEALVLANIQRVEMLDALGEDTIADKARLRRCLTHPSPGAMEVAPAAGHATSDTPMSS